MPAEYNGVNAYRDRLANRLQTLRAEGNTAEAAQVLSNERLTLNYPIARKLHQNPTIFTQPSATSFRTKEYHSLETQRFGYPTSNEFYAGLAESLRNTGGIGFAVGTDQPFDFFIMANLDEMYAVDIDPQANFITRAYAEVGSRFHHMFARYPTTDEFIELFKPQSMEITLSLLQSPSQQFQFESDNLNSQFFLDLLGSSRLADYLAGKREFYKGASWIGTDENLESMIKGYDEGKIHLCHGSIDGEIIPRVARDLKRKGKEVSLLYLSNAPVRTEQSLQQFQKLPFADIAKIIFSKTYDVFDFSHNFDEQLIIYPAKVPNGYRYGFGSWIFYLFSPQDYKKSFPNPSTMDEVEAVGNGTYFVKPISPDDRFLKSFRGIRRN